jgi:DNA repair exonuclease SbcCD nuclease subunit
MTRVIHTGDTHLGYQQYHSPDRRRDFLDAFRYVIEDAIGADVDAVIHAGDLFHDRRPELVDILGTLSVLRELNDANIPFLAIVGNHEVKRDAQWLDLFASLGLATRLGSEPVVIGETAFYGLDYVPKSKREELTYDFADHNASSAALVSHGLFQPFDYGDWDAEVVLRDSSVTFDALLLGDNHKPDIKRAENGTWLTYCGSTERASAAEREERGYNIVTFDDDVAISRRGLATREFQFVDIELATEEGVRRVRDRINEYDHTDSVSIVSIEGDGKPISPAEIEDELRDAGALVVRVNDRREFEETSNVTVSFADPDDAVREQIRELGLSPAAHELDEVIRASKVADTAVTETVEQRVKELIETEGDQEMFNHAPETAVNTGAGPEPSRAADRLAETETETGKIKSDSASSKETADTNRSADTPESEGTDPPADKETNRSTGDNQTEWGDFA